MKKYALFMMLICFVLIGISQVYGSELRYEQNQIYGYREDGTLYQNEFVEIDQEYYYFKEDGTALTSSWKKTNGNYYYFGSEGKALKGIHYLGVQYFGFSQEGLRLRGYHEIDNQRFFFNSMGASVRAFYEQDGNHIFLYGNGNYARNRFFKKDNHNYVFNSKGYVVKSKLYDASHIKKRDVYKVYCDENGWIQEGFINYENQIYYMDLASNRGYYVGFHEIDGKIYYFYEDGHAARNEWIHTEEGKYYMQEDGSAYRNQKTCIDNQYYYFNADGLVMSGYFSVEIDAVKHYFYCDENGASQVGLHTLPDSNSTRYFNGDGSIVRSDFVEVEGQTYFLTKEGIVSKNNWRNIGQLDLDSSSFYIHCDENGVIQQGRHEVIVDGVSNYYYLDLSAPKGYRTGLVAEQGVLYGYASSSGKALKGVKQVGDDLYYFQDDYTAYQNGWITMGGKHYYFREDGRGYLEQLVTLNDNPYYFTSSGYVANGYRNVTIDDKKYYFFYDENGISLTGLYAVPNTSYSRYFNGDGSVLTREFYEIDDQLYFFTSSGILFVGNWRNAGKYDMNLGYDLYIHTDDNGVVAQGYTEFVRDGKDVVYYFDRSVEFGHRLGLVDCGELGVYYFLKSQTYGSVAKGFYSDPKTMKTYAFDEESGALRRSGQFKVAGTNISYPILEDGTLDFNQPITNQDGLKEQFIKLCINELYKGYGHDSFTQMENVAIENITKYSCSGFVIRLLYELYDHVDYFSRNHDLLYQAYCKRENGEKVKVWSKYFPKDQLIAGDLVVINKYDCYSDVDDVGDLSIIDINEDGICDREHEPFLGNDGKLVYLHVHHIGVYLGDGYYINSIPGRGVCIQKIPEDNDRTEVSAYARVLE